MIVRKTILTVSMLVLCTSAFSKRLITPDESEPVLRATLEKTPGCIVMDELANLPVSFDPGSMSTKRTRKVMLAMADAGLLKREDKQVEMSKQIAFGMNQKVKVNANVFSMTETGEKYFREDALQISRSASTEPKKGAGFCYADRLEVTAIKQNLGSYITYYVHVPERADWANNKKILKTGLIADKSRRQITYPKIKGQPAPPQGKKVQAKVSIQENGELKLTHY